MAKVLENSYRAMNIAFIEEWSRAAEAVGVATSLGLQTAFLGQDRDPVSLLPGYLLGVVQKDDDKDRGRLLAYWDGPVKRRADGAGRIWKQLLELRPVLEAGGETRAGGPS